MSKYTFTPTTPSTPEWRKQDKKRENNLKRLQLRLEMLKLRQERTALLIQKCKEEIDAIGF